MKRRLLKLFVIGLLVVLFTGYFAFSTFLFSPTEGDLEARVNTLIPRDVDFYFAKQDLADDFDPFPRPAFLDELEATEAGETWFASPEWEAQRADLGLADLEAQITASLEQLPIAIEPLDVLGGRSIAVAGYFRGKELADADWAVYARGNWMAKLAYSALHYPGLLDLESRGYTAIADEEVVSISGGKLPRTLHLTRLRDVLVVSTDPGMVESASTLAARSGEDSFGGSARYYDHIQTREREGNELEVYVDYRSLSEAKQYTGRWPDANAEDFFPAFMGRLFQSGALKELVGIAGVDDGVSIDLHGELSSELVSAYQKQLYRQRGYDRDKLYQVARLAPEDTGVFAYFHAPFAATLRTVMQSTERALQDNVNDLVREVWAHPDMQGLIEELDAAFQDRAALIVRSNDYPTDSTGPPNDGMPVLAWTLVLWVDSGAKIEDVRRKIIDNQGYFGIQGREPGGSGVFTNELRGGQVIHEFWSPFIPGTGHLASVIDQDRFLLSNNYKMLEHVLKTWFEGAPTYPRLTDDTRFGYLVESALDHANIAIWGKPEALSESLRKMARRAAEDEVVIDWSVMRGQIDRRVLRENFPEWDYESLTEDQAAQLETLAAEERNRYQREVEDAQVPALQAKYERQILYAEAVSALLFEIGLDPKKLDLALRALVPLEE